MDKQIGRDPVTITILGSGTCVPSLERSSCSVLIQGGGDNFLLDAGPGTMHQLIRAGMAIDDIDALMLSHFHPDHASELSGFLFSRKHSGDKDPEKQLHIAGGPGFIKFFNRLNHAFEGRLSHDSFKLHELPYANSLPFKSFTIATASMVHAPESIAYGFTSRGNLKIVYTGDTDFSHELVRFAEDADLLICESSFPDELKKKGHLTPSLAGRVAHRAGVKKLILTHLYPVCDRTDILSQCRKAYGGEIEIARDLMRIEI